MQEQNKQEYWRELFLNANKIVFLGDGITEAASQEEGYIWLLDRHLKAISPTRNFELVNAGISGHRSFHLRQRFQQDVLSENPDLLFINVGVNDVGCVPFRAQEKDYFPYPTLPYGNPLEQYQEDLRVMLELARSQELETIFLSPTIVRENLNGLENQRLIDYIKSMQIVAIENGYLFIDLNQAFRNAIANYQKENKTNKHFLTYDGAHPNSAGYRIIANTILQSMDILDRFLTN